MILAKTYTQRLAELQVIIEKLESGVASYSVSSGAGSRSYTQHSLTDLYKREQFLQTKADQEARGGGISRTRVFTG